MVIPNVCQTLKPLRNEKSGIFLCLTTSVGNNFVSLPINCILVHKKNQVPFEELTSYYTELGNNHQYGLNCILEDLKAATSESDERLNMEQLFKEVQETSIDFTIEKLGLDNSFENGLLKVQESIKISLTKSDNNQGIVEMMIGQIQLTDNEIRYLKRLDLILSSVSDGIDQCICNIRNLEYEIYSSCSSSEIEFLFTATAIGANSLEYWYNNYDIWAEELHMPELIDKKGIAHKEWFWSSLSRMGRMDIIGGITGAAVGAFAGGVGAIPGALAGACYASGNCGVLCLYEHLTK